MKTLQAVRYGGPDALEVRDVPLPRASADDVVVAVVASSINPVDVKMRSLEAPQQIAGFPATLGWDLAGIVVSAPDECAWRPGDRVVALHPPSAVGTGSWAQVVSLPPDRLVPAPVTVDLATAAALPLAGLTALQALDRLSLRPQERLLVTGAIGAVGGYAVQLAVHRGVAVSALVSRQSHVQEAMGMGARASSADAQDLQGFDAVFDTAGVLGDACLVRAGGRLVTVSDDAITGDVAERASAADHNYVRHDPAGLRSLVALVDQGALRIRVAEVFPFQDVRAAHERFEQGGLVGKVVVTF
ncbi:NADP-dependent oxidoreductase [Cellulomonas hominis]|uniref:NADP-dependent oxidoreductase n=1 Tax=Cellulomonas hominis TaxID=156981 RepID=UPI001BCA8A9F|nr:NADP-dependent oxidoreductase [Cellulomonas hominis]